MEILGWLMLGMMIGLPLGFKLGIHLVRTGVIRV